MSMQAAKDFLKRIKTDKALEDQLEAAADQAARHQLVKSAGFDFTADEYKQAAQNMATAQELTADELGHIDGGLGAPTGPVRPGWCVFYKM